MAFYSKYRPQNFANLVGQEHIRKTLLYEIQQGSLAHAYLFAGPRGTGKTTTARLIAKALNCTARNAEGEPCDACEMCTGTKDGSLIDVMEIDAASNRGIDEIRDLKEKIQFAPTRARSKIYIIDEIHMLTKEAFNALLKTLEEPPENVYFLLCTTEIHKIPETIISRCQRFDFKRIDVKTIMTRLSFIAQKEGIEAEDEAVELIARHVEGGLRDAIGLMEQMAVNGKVLAEHVRSHLGIAGHAAVKSFLETLEGNDAPRALSLVNDLHREGYELSSFVREMLEFLRERLVHAVGHEPLEVARWLAMIEHFEDARDMLRNTVIPQLPLEIAVIKICGQNAVMATETPAQKPEAQKTETQKAEAQRAEEQTAAELKKEFETEHLKNGDIVKDWARVMEHVQPPSLKRSLADARVSQKEEGTVTLTFRARFHMEKADTAEHRAKIEKAIEHVFGKKMKLICMVEALAHEPGEEQTAPARESPQPARAKKSSSPQDLAKKAMEIFGEE